ncbi:hypothetical protein ABZ896_44000 [Streptomyces sp. NPDC047072]|uniref:hypothetical protein n=1 Tax=Streptomyces sp. NPDC047072 TaxID=3154809 RepID=UPI0033C35C1C
MFLRRLRQDDDDSEPYWKQRSWQMSAGFIALVIVMGALVALTSSGSDSTGGGTARARASDGPLSGTATLVDGRPKDCATDDSAGDALPTAVPKDITWRTIGVVQVPVSASAGPTRFQGALWWCYAHTPTGAALAATAIIAQMSEPGWRTVADQQVVAGTGQKMFVFQRSQVADTARRTDGSSSSCVGFTVVSYTGEAATIALLIKGTEGFLTTSVQVRWDDGDWKVLAGSDGSLYSGLTTVQNAGRYLVWRTSGVKDVTP